MPIALDRYINNDELVRRVNRDAADQLAEAIDNARITLVEAFCGAMAVDLDADNQPVIFAGAERTIDHALAALCDLQDEFRRKGSRA